MHRELQSKPKGSPKGSDGAPTVLGPTEILAAGRSVDQVVAVLARGFRVQRGGRLQLFDEAADEALRGLGATLDVLIPEAQRRVIAERSGLGWPVFCEHVVGWWYPQRARLGFLRALVDRARLHGVELRLHWNEGRAVPPRQRQPGPAAVAVGAAIGGVVGLLLTRDQSWNSVLGLLALGAGAVAGRLYQRTRVLRDCGDRLCRTPLSRRDQSCPGCGAGIA